MADNTTKVWFITGSSTGFGRSLTKALLKRGVSEAPAKQARVVATARKPEQLTDLIHQYPETLKAVRLDVTQPQEVRNAVNTALDTFGRIDVLVNNAGYGAFGAVEELSDDVIRRQFETNVFGALNVMRFVLPVMRKQRYGHIVNFSSVAGFVAFEGTGIYCGTKFALEGISEALAKEVAPLGIKVTIIEPGAFRTDFNGRSLVTPDELIDDYAFTSGEFIKWVRSMEGRFPGDPDKAALAIIRAVESDNSPLRLALGADTVSAIDAKLKSVKEELDTWKSVACDTAFAGVQVGAIGSSTKSLLSVTTHK